MRILSICVALFGLLALVVAEEFNDMSGAGLGVTALLCALATWRSVSLSSFLKIFVAIFSVETIVFGLGVLAAEASLWPAAYAEYKLPVTLPITVAIFSILVYLVAQTKVVRQMMRIADRYFDTTDSGQARIWPLPAFTSLERRIAVAMVVFLVLINQAQVGINVRLSFFNRDWFNAIQAKDAATFWQLLLLVFMPWAMVYVASALIEFFVQSMLVIRWRRWLTDFFVARWLGGHTHYRMSLTGSQADNPDQRIAEDVNRFIDGGSDGSNGSSAGIYSYSILLISTLSSLVSFAVVLWGLSTNFTMPFTDLHVPGFLFWVALIYAAAGTLITHVIGRSLVGLYFERQHMEADFRFSLARLREYTEQVALLDGERAEEASLSRRFGGIIGNWLALINRRTKLLAFTQTYGQLSPIIPFIFTAPFYFADKIALGIMTQTAGAFSRVEGALTFFVSYYNSLAGFKSVVDRLTSFDEAIEQARKLGTQGPRRTAEVPGAEPVALEDIHITLPDGTRIVKTENLALPQGQSALLAGPSGSGKSTLFRAISGIWPYGEGRIRIPEGANVMVVPQKPYIPIGTLRAAITYPAAPNTYSDEAISKALVDVRLANLTACLDRDEAWSQRLSGGEQQRIALARALLTRPDWLFLDESTSALDEKLEAELYGILASRLPKTTIVSIGHRSTLGAFHTRRLDMTEAEGGHFTPRDTPAAAAE
jgi:vitamin B12/bleomycin/antimicrobial peptide transport system ATP-binding/permease protein